MDFLNGALPAATNDEFCVDDLLDFSKIDDEQEQKENTFSFFSVSEKTEHGGFNTVSETELFVPADGVEDLEWLSQFVDDTISGCSLPLPVVLKNQSKPEPVKPVRTKARSKRAKTGGRVWSFKPPPPPSQPRRCSHCHVQKTPQWRTGPLGAKTLCNACGVRFKSGRLLPEYRPASSPTFLREVHSNNHRKVLEMRRKKEGEPGSQQLN